MANETPTPEPDLPVYAVFRSQVARLGYDAQSAQGRMVPFVLIRGKRALLAFLRGTSMDVNWYGVSDGTGDTAYQQYTVYPTGQN